MSARLAGLLALLLAACDARTTPNRPTPADTSRGPAVAERPGRLHLPPAPEEPEEPEDDDEPDAGPVPMVTLKVSVFPEAPADVIWGAKRLGKIAGKPLEIVRPRDSGPLDIIVRAPGYLPFHTRLFTHKDDKVTARLVKPSGASGMFGYRPTAPAN